MRHAKKGKKRGFYGCGSKDREEHTTCLRDLLDGQQQGEATTDDTLAECFSNKDGGTYMQWDLGTMKGRIRQCIGSFIYQDESWRTHIEAY